MDETPPLPGLTNAAWVKIHTPLKSQELFSFCKNIEKLFRLNPFLKIDLWERKNQSGFNVSWQNHSNEEMFKVDTSIQVENKSNQIQVKYELDTKQTTTFIVNSLDNQSELVIVDDYGSDEASSPQVIDKSINAWGKSLNRFFKHYMYLRHVPFLDTVIDKLWIRMNPMARRISYMLFVITSVEILVLMLFVLTALLRK